MAIFDAMLEFSDNQDVGANSAGTGGAEASTNVFNFTQSDLEMGAGEPLWLNVRIGTEDVGGSGGTSTLSVGLYRDTDSTIDTDSTLIFVTEAFAESALVSGSWMLRQPLPYNVDEDAYIGLIYTVGTTTTTAGTVDAWIGHGPQSSFDTQVSASNI